MERTGKKTKQNKTEQKGQKTRFIYAYSLVAAEVELIYWRRRRKKNEPKTRINKKQKKKNEKQQKSKIQLPVFHSKHPNTLLSISKTINYC